MTSCDNVYEVEDYHKNELDPHTKITDTFADKLRNAALHSLEEIYSFMVGGGGRGGGEKKKKKNFLKPI